MIPFLAEPLEWFYRNDLFVDIINVIVLGFIFFLAIQCARINRDKSAYRSFILAFGSLAFGGLFKIVTHVNLIYTLQRVKHVGEYIVTYHQAGASPVLPFVGLFASRFFTILGLYLLLSVYFHQRSRFWLLLGIYFLLVVSYFSNRMYYLFHFTSFLLLLAVTSSLLHHYRISHHRNTLFLAGSFLLLTVGHALYTVVAVYPPAYIIAKLIELAGSLCLLFTLLKVLHDGKKKRAA